MQWFEEGEKPTKYFASLEKRNYVNKLINKLNVDGQITENQIDILRETRNYYQRLYTSRVNIDQQNIRMDQFLNEQNIRPLSEEQKLTCEGNITTDEIANVIKKMKNDKTPGIDGLPVEFYKFCWLSIGHFLQRSIQ